jgi:hypothetical protein
MKNKTKQILLAASVATFIGFSVNLLWSGTESMLAADNFDCVFDAKSTENGASSGNSINAIKRITLTGYIDDPFKQNRYDFFGNATIYTQATVLEAYAGGHVHIDQDGTPLGVHLKIESERFGSDQIYLMTLNERGVEDYGRDQAYLFSSLAKETSRLSNPMAMRCNSELG